LIKGMIDSSPSSFADTQPRQLVTLVSILVREPCEKCGAAWNLKFWVVQAETKDLISRFGLLTSPTNYIVEAAGVDICPFADMSVFLCGLPGRC
jgi:hypothetical protein